MFSFLDTRKAHNRLRWIGKTQKMVGTSGNSFMALTAYMQTAEEQSCKRQVQNRLCFLVNLSKSRYLKVTFRVLFGKIAATTRWNQQSDIRVYCDCQASCPRTEKVFQLFRGNQICVTDCNEMRSRSGLVVQRNWARGCRMFGHHATRGSRESQRGCGVPSTVYLHNPETLRRFLSWIKVNSFANPIYYWIAVNLFPCETHWARNYSTIGTSAASFGPPLSDWVACGMVEGMNRVPRKGYCLFHLNLGITRPKWGCVSLKSRIPSESCMVPGYVGF